ncbi:Uncharacterized protein APZ42_020482 [Daphnia magna]|uniref:Uncharacterized protein n=1 Tax=Daphnia magna TaxID=35525 RepID=A0A164XHX6_9CRUS|nr:Uncharacterized protein APZ42_020482 [Daphnia magna]
MFSEEPVIRSRLELNNKNECCVRGDKIELAEDTFIYWNDGKHVIITSLSPFCRAVRQSRVTRRELDAWKHTMHKTL